MAMIPPPGPDDLLEPVATRIILDPNRPGPGRGGLSTADMPAVAQMQAEYLRGEWTEHPEHLRVEYLTERERFLLYLVKTQRISEDVP